MAHIDSKRYDLSTFKDIEKLSEEITNTTIKCKCSHSIVMPNAERTICRWCGEYVYRTPEIEFKYKMKEAIIKERK